MKKSYLSIVCLLAMIVFAVSGCQQSSTTSEEESTEMAEESDSEAEESEEAEEEAPASPRMQSTNEIGGVSITVDYGSPAVKGRTVWGELEPYGKVWRAGANETTSVELSGDVTVNGETLAAGKYAFFLIPNEEGDWVAIFNEEWSRDLHGAWGAFGYKEEKDVLRLNVTPQWSDDVAERLSYEVTADGISFGWEKARIDLAIAAAGN